MKYRLLLCLQVYTQNGTATLEKSVVISYDINTYLQHAPAIASMYLSKEIKSSKICT